MTNLKAGGKPFAGKYTLVEIIGQGKFKETWYAFDEIMQREVALKIIKQEGSNIDELIREASNHTKLEKHPNIVQIYDASKDIETNYSYISEEFIKVETLEEISKKGLTETEIIDILMQLSDGLAHAHKKGVIHRDLKPSNIIMKGKTPIIIDWGGSSESGIKHIPIDGVHGSILFRSPEALDGSTDPKVDTYALGVLGYFLLTKQFPFIGDNYKEIKDKIRNQTPRKPREYPGINIISNKLEKIIINLLNKKPRKRYTAKQLKRKLWRCKNKNKIIAGLCIAGIVIGTAASITAFKLTKPPYWAFTYLSQNNLMINSYELLHKRILIKGVTSYAFDRNKHFFVTRNKDIFSYNYLDETSLKKITDTPDEQETNIQVSPSGNLISFMLGKDVYVMRRSGKLKRKVLENIDEYVWYTQKDQITYRQGNELFITDTSPFPKSEKNAKRLGTGTCPRWYNCGSALFYLKDWKGKRNIWFKHFKYSDNIGVEKEVPDNGIPVSEDVTSFTIDSNDEYISYFSPKEGRLYIIDLNTDFRNGFGLHHLEHVENISFSPCGNRVLFRAKIKEEKDYEIFCFNRPAKKLQRITQNNISESHPIYLIRKSLN